MLRRYQRNLVGGAGLAGWLGLFFVPGDDFKEGSEGAFYFFIFFPFLCKGDGGRGGTRSCSNCFGSLPQDYYDGAIARVPRLSLLLIILLQEPL